MTTMMLHNNCDYAICTYVLKKWNWIFCFSYSRGGDDDGDGNGNAMVIEMAMG